MTSAEQGPGRTGLAVGVDGGATGSRCVALTPEGEVAGRETGPAAAVDPEAPAGSVETVARLARRVAAVGIEGARPPVDAGDPPPADALCAALAGAGDPDLRRELEEALEEAGDWGRVLVVPDAEAARQDAFGEAPGIVLVAGTGAVAWGRGEDGRAGRADGLGPAAGDEGSAYDLGRRSLRASVRDLEGRGPATWLTPSLIKRICTGGAPAAGNADARLLSGWAAAADRAEIAAVAKLACRQAAEGDPVARGLVRDAAARLAGTARSLARRLGPWTAPPPLALAGGLLEGSEALRTALVDALPPGSFRLLHHHVDGARGAARLARRAADGAPDPPLP